MSHGTQTRHRRRDTHSASHTRELVGVISGGGTARTVLLEGAETTQVALRRMSLPLRACASLHAGARGAQDMPTVDIS